MQAPATSDSPTTHVSPRFGRCRRGDASGDRRPRPIPRLPGEEPPQPVGRPADDLKMAVVDAPQVMERADADLVVDLVAAAVRPEQHVVRLRGAVAAARHLALAVIPVADLPGAALRALHRAP